MKSRLSWEVFLLSSVLMVSCGTTKSTDEDHYQRRKYSVQSVIWQQNAAEYKALCYQAFNTAKSQLDRFLEKKGKSGKKPAIVTDIDETVLDNSPFNAKLIEKNEEYTKEEWANWVHQIAAEAIPGAEEFLNYAEDRGVEVFYVTNRLERAEKATLKNMKEVNFPYADGRHLLLRAETGAKKNRFEQVAEQYDILLFMGDNLSDFSSQFRVPSTKKRNALAEYYEDEFGKKFIVLPNPMYGDWETKGIYQGKYHWTDQEKAAIRKAAIKAY